METPSYRELRWRRFEAALGTWLDTPEGRFAQFCARRERELAERRALLRRVALAVSVLPASCVGCALRLALVSPGRAAEELDELLTGAR
ncbi:MAG TPA: hypothetical protein VD769_07815 [Gaiellaceae bacterium]|nr:hypothetical protein [Gaiellaceae bacterium]